MQKPIIQTKDGKIDIIDSVFKSKKSIEELSKDELVSSFVELYEMIQNSPDHFTESNTPAQYATAAEISKNINEALKPSQKDISYISLIADLDGIEKGQFRQKAISIAASTNSILQAYSSLNIKTGNTFLLLPKRCRNV